jgi:DNA-binding NtrC family response regulator
LSYDWPGNVRELENAVERAVVLRSGDVILPEDLPDSVLEAQGADAPLAKYHATVQESKKQLILKALAAANGNYTEAAKTLGVHPNYLHRLVRNLNIRQQ